MQPAKGITKLIYVDDLGSSPARVNKRTGVLYINKRIWETLKPQYRLFVMLHEAGHVVLQSNNEYLVDEWAFNEYVKRGHSLKDAVFALSKVLSGRSPEHIQRIYSQLQRAKQYDNRNYIKKRTKKISRMTKQNPNTALYKNTGLPFPQQYMIADHWGDTENYEGKNKKKRREAAQKRKDKIQKRRLKFGEKQRKWKIKRRKRKANLERKFKKNSKPFKNLQSHISPPRKAHLLNESINPVFGRPMNSHLMGQSIPRQFNNEVKRPILPHLNRFPYPNSKLSLSPSQETV